MSQPYKLGKLTRQRSDGSRYTEIVIKYHDQDGPHRVSLGTACLVTAEASARRFWNNRTLARSDSVGVIVGAYLDGLNGLKDEDRKRNRWGKMKPFWAHLTLNDIDLHTSQTAYPAWRGMAANTLRNELSLIKSAMRWALERKSIDAMPIIKLPTQPQSTVSHLTKAQFKLFLGKCVMPHVKLFSILAVTTGARKSALLDAKWDQVDFDRCFINLLGDKVAVANKTRATVPLNDRAMDALREAKQMALSEHIIEHGGERIHDVKKGINAAGTRASLHVTPHMFRHSAAVWMAEDRVPMSEIAAFLGHKDSRITERVYARYHPDFLRQASRSLDW